MQSGKLKLSDSRPSKEASAGVLSAMSGVLSPKTTSSNIYLAKAIESSYTKTKAKKKGVFKEMKKDEPENQTGRYIHHPDASKQEPRDFLLIARVVKRNCRPLTVAEVKHKQRANVLFKLDNEIRSLQ